MASPVFCHVPLLTPFHRLYSQFWFLLYGHVKGVTVVTSWTLWCPQTWALLEPAAALACHSLHRPPANLTGLQLIHAFANGAAQAL